MFSNLHAPLVSLTFYLQLPLQTAMKPLFASNALCMKHFKIFSYKCRLVGDGHQQPPPNPRIVKIDLRALIPILNLKRFTDPRIIFINSSTTSLAKAASSTGKTVLKGPKTDGSGLFVLEMFALRKIVLGMMMLRGVGLETLRCSFLR